MLLMCVVFPALKSSCDPINGQCYPAKLQFVVANISLYWVALGSRATRPCVSSFGGGQFDDTKQRSSFFNWSFMIQNAGMMISTSVVVWLEISVSWAWGFGVSATAMAISLAHFSFGTPLYQFQQPGGSPLTKMCQVIIASI